MRLSVENSRSSEYFFEVILVRSAKRENSPGAPECSGSRGGGSQCSRSPECSGVLRSAPEPGAPVLLVLRSAPKRSRPREPPPPLPEHFGAPERQPNLLMGAELVRRVGGLGGISSHAGKAMPDCSIYQVVPISRTPNSCWLPCQADRGYHLWRVVPCPDQYHVNYPLQYIISYCLPEECRCGWFLLQGMLSGSLSV
jgi:hypothetical protein